MSTGDTAIPILPSRSLPGTLAFYQRLGFSGTLLAHDTYAILTRGSVELHFMLHRDLVPGESHACCYLRVTDVEATARAFAGAGLPRTGIPRLDPVEDKPWGMRECALVDPDGNLLRIGQPR